MSNLFLVIDFGTTSTKSALVDLDSGDFIALQRLSQGAPTRADSAGSNNRHELSLTELLERFSTICHDAWQHHHFEGIVLCSEMHGFAVIDEEGKPQTEYVSWLDARSLETVGDGPSTHDLIVEHLGEDFRRLTGMRPRPGFPLLNLAHTARTGGLRSDNGWVLSLPAVLACLSHDGVGDETIEHPTMLAAMALADVEAGSTASPDLLRVVEETSGFRARLGKTSQEGQVAGHWPGPDGLIPIYAGVGDHQCSVLGAAPTPGTDANLNLGTGSQVGIVDGPADSAFERRPYFDGRHLTAVTHIPAGRALNEYVGFLEAIATRAGGETDFWKILAEVTGAGLQPDKIQQGSLSVDLAIFEGARGWTSGGSIGGIVEGSLGVENYLAAVIRAFTQQYVDVLATLDPDHRLQRLVLSGGIARRLPHLRQMLAASTPYDVLPAVELDESLLGLRALALHAAGRAATVADAAALFGRQCRIRSAP
ncbi:MAG: hypothetical protein HN712_13750 [Gemmatimonadetes bacterium]|nr:hypothetical protein [Gemmatimonadota bacterium]MBT7861381.1 hypothetical protein [Gemmatimonadota bacterium]